MIFGGRYRGQAAYRGVDRLFEGGTRRDMARRPGADLFGENGGCAGQHDGIKQQAKQDAGPAVHRHHCLGLFLLQMNHLAFSAAGTAASMREATNPPCTRKRTPATSATRARLRSRQAWKNRPAQINGARTSGTARLSMPAAPPGSHSCMPASSVNATTDDTGPARTTPTGKETWWRQV